MKTRYTLALCALAGLAVNSAVIAEGLARTEANRIAYEALHSAVGDEPTDTLTVLLPGTTLIYSGAWDAFSTADRFAYFAADSLTEAQASPSPAASMAGGFTVHVTAPGGEGFSAEGCKLVTFDVLAGLTHAYLRCPG